VIALLLAALVAYVPSSASLLKRAAARVTAAGRSKEATLSGTLTVRGEPARAARMVLRFPLSCRLEGDGGLSLAVRGTTEKPVDNVDAAPAARLLQLACPFIAYRGLKSEEAELALHAAAASLGADLNVPTSLSRFIDRVVYVVGSAPRDLSRPQLWIYKDSNAPARVISQDADLRLLQYGNPAAADWFPRVLELWIDGQQAAKFEVLETRGMRGIGEEEEYSRPE
jgi:hypothetical protein